MITTNDAPPTVIAICGSERSGGNTDLLLEYATRRFAQHSIVMTTIHLRDEGVSGPCTVPPRLRKAFTRPVFRLLFFLRQHPAGRHSHVPITTFGYIVEARRRCRGVGTGLFTVMSRENLPGGGLGKIVSPQNLAVVTTVVQAPGKDAEILKKAAPFSLGLLVLLGALVFIAAQGWLGGYFPPR